MEVQEVQEYQISTNTPGAGGHRDIHVTLIDKQPPASRVIRKLCQHASDKHVEPFGILPRHQKSTFGRVPEHQKPGRLLSRTAVVGELQGWCVPRSIARTMVQQLKDNTAYTKGSILTDGQCHVGLTRRHEGTQHRDVPYEIVVGSARCDLSSVTITQGQPISDADIQSLVGASLTSLA